EKVGQCVHMDDASRAQPLDSLHENPCSSDEVRVLEYVRHDTGPALSTWETNHCDSTVSCDARLPGAAQCDHRDPQAQIGSRCCLASRSRILRERALRDMNNVERRSKRHGSYP